MRISDVLMNGDDDFSGNPSAAAALIQTKRRRIFERLSPRSVLSRCFPSAKRTKEQRFLVVKIEESERETRREGLDGREKKEVGCSTNCVSGEPSSCVLKRGSEKVGEVSGQCRKVDCFNLAVGFGVFYLTVASKNELNKMIELRRQMEMFLLNFKEEFQNQSRQILSKQSETNNSPAYSTTDAQESLCADKNVSLQNVALFENQADSETIVLSDQSPTGDASRQEECVEGIDQLEAELEMELERLQLQLDTEYISEYPKQQTMEMTVEDTAPIISLNASLGDVVDDPQGESIREEHFVIPPNELERRLHELVESRQEQRIKELETALECANQKLWEKERELCWWQDAARHISQRVPMTSRLSS